MKELKKLYNKIIQRANINLREIEIDTASYIQKLIPLSQLLKFYAFYGVSPNHPLNFYFKHSNLSGSYFLGKCKVTNSLLYKSDIRGDELKKKGETFQYKEFNIAINKDEGIYIEDSFLTKTLVHNFSHDPETPEIFYIRDTISMPYANIHGSPTQGGFLGPFSTIDLTTIHDCIIGTFSYLQVGEISHLNIPPGTIWIRNQNEFNFLYQYPANQLNNFIYFAAGSLPQGIFIDFLEDRKEAFQLVFDMLNLEQLISVPDSASLDRYAVAKGQTNICENVLVAQRAFLQNAWLGKGANVQENCYIINSRLEGFNVTAHGTKIIEADLGNNVFVGFNSFLRGRPDGRLTIGNDSIILPHTIIDIREPLDIPEGQIAWGMITNMDDLKVNSLPIEDFQKIESTYASGNMFYEGNGNSFITAFKDRIHHILEANGAFFDGTKNRGHAQKNQKMSFNTLQPYPEGDLEGLYPTIIIRP